MNQDILHLQKVFYVKFLFYPAGRATFLAKPTQKQLYEQKEL